MSTPIIHHHDNTRVSRMKWGCEYFSVTFREPEDYAPYHVSVSRYCVPGRCDSYAFDFVPGGAGVGPRVRYFTDTGLTLPAAIAKIQGDLDKPQVVELLLTACQIKGNSHYARQLTDCLLAVIAPKSKSVKALRKLLTDWRKP